MSVQLTNAVLANLTDEQLEARKHDIFHEWAMLVVQCHMLAGTPGMIQSEILSAKHRDTVMPLLNAKVLAGEITYMRSRFLRLGYQLGW